jgi:hypothetical protein
MPRKPYWSVETFSGEPSPESSAMAARIRGDDTFPWPAEAEPERVRVRWPTDAPYDVWVGFTRDRNDEPVPVEVTIRRTFPTSTTKRDGKYQLAEGVEPEPVSAVDLRQIPLARVMRAALVAKKRDGLSDERHDELDRILVPRGRPQRGRSAPFYRELLAAARRLEQGGVSPANEIARRKRVSPNLVNQWLHVARQLEEKQ